MARAGTAPRIQTERLRFFRARLLDFFRKSGRSELSWRRKGITAYEVWVSEVMLQQTQVSRVIAYYPRFLKKFPTVKRLAQANWEEFLPYYAGLGYYARGRNMLRTAKAVVDEYGGQFPQSVPALEALPGIGPYTARAIASFAAGAPELAWDTNLRRVIGRFFLGAKDRIGKVEQKFFGERLGAEAPRLNAALMDFGSAICTARPKCANCPLRESCRYFREHGRQEVKPQISKVKYQKSRPERVMVFLHEGHRQYFSSRRKRYAPFLLPAGCTTRAAIKEYFRVEYGFELAVRPPHTSAVRAGIGYLLVNAQILLGENRLAAFPKSAVLEYTEREKLS